MSDYSAKIIGTGKYVPEKILTNEDLEKLVETSDEWIQTRTGMIERRVAAPEQATSDLAYEAAQKAIANAGIKTKDIDLIVVGTISADHPVPSAACILQNKLGLKNIPAFDVSAGCPGWIFAMDVVKHYVEAGTAKTVLAIGVEILTKITNYEDRGTCILFGDAAGASIVQRTKHTDISHIIDSDINADASHWDILYQPAGGSKMPASEETVKDNLHTITMQGNKVFKLAVKSMYSSCKKILKRNNLDINTIDWLITHQANLRIIKSLGKKLKIDTDKVIVNIEKYGNTSSATIPVALDEAIEEGKIKKGDLVLMSSFGAGMTYGSLLIRY